MEGSVRLAPLVSRYFSTAIYLIFAEIRFQLFCKILYYRKRPRIVKNYISSIVLTIIMLFMCFIVTIL